VSDERWTEDTRDGLASVIDDACPSDAVVSLAAFTRMSEAGLQYLADAGLLVTPQMRAVIEAARAWRHSLLGDGSSGQRLARFDAACPALRAAVDAYEGQREDT
jgi:hypothetical protein